MSKTLNYCFLAMFCMVVPPSLLAQSVSLRSGRLLQCTIVEPHFSSHSAQIGEPLICQARPLREFGRMAIPSGAYFVGQLAAAREPGHLVGKGWMKLEFDRLIFPNTDVSVTAKVVSVGDFDVDAQGRIVGHGHATRDTLGWLIPPLWPVKLITLPERGPRPTLKGEVPVTIRLLEDVSIPAEAYVTSSAANNAVDGQSMGLRADSWNSPSRSRQVKRYPVDSGWHSFRTSEDQDRYSRP